MINPVFNKIDLYISSIIKDLPKHGILRQASSGLVYLDIDDRYIHDIFPQIKHKNILKPNYFSEPNAIGAHISVIYPEEIHLKKFYLN